MNDLERYGSDAALVGQWQRSIAEVVATDEMAANTARTYQIGLGHYLTWCMEQGWSEATSVRSVRAWVAALREAGRAPATINVWLAGVRHFMRWLVEQEIIEADPTASVKRPAGKRKIGHKRDVLTDDEVRRLLRAPDASTMVGLRDSAILHLLAYQALRLVEVQRADLVHLRTAQNRLVLDVHGKGRVEADEFVVLAKDAVVDAVYAWLNVRGKEPGPLFYSLSNRTHGQRLSARSLQQIVSGYFADAGVLGERKTAHSLRHTAITNARRHGAPLRKVQIWARHASIETTMIYDHELERLESPAEEFVSYG